jgi:hypothetical protein
MEDWCECIRVLLQEHVRGYQSIMQTTDQHTLLVGDQGLAPQRTLLLWLLID